MTTKHISVGTNRPTEKFVADIEAAGFKVIGWRQPSWMFTKRKTSRNTHKTGRGWIDLRYVDSGDLVVRFEEINGLSSSRAHDAVIAAGKKHNINVAIGGCTHLD